MTLPRNMVLFICCLSVVYLMFIFTVNNKKALTITNCQTLKTRINSGLFHFTDFY